MTDGYDCYQNAIAERVNGILKTELLLQRPQDLTQAKKMVSESVAIYNARASAPIFEISNARCDEPSVWVKQVHRSTRQYARIVKGWVKAIGLDPAMYGTQTMRRTKASLIYRRTKNLRAVQLLLGHTKLESTVRYLGIEVDDALEMAEQTEV
tara:strand:+ start:68 stop:526 length:459 start_codon:yes stop_codon:yes gene_type:complete